jgi:hypothetical protein
MTARESTQEQTQPEYMSKKVVINGQTVTLYSLNGVTWLSTPDQLPDTMARLDNTRILLHDPKSGEVSAAPAPAPAPKATAARYRMRGPKPRPILQPDGTLAPVVEREPVAATETQVQITHQEIQVVREPKKDPRTAFSKHLDGNKGVTPKAPTVKVRAEKESRAGVEVKKVTPQKASTSAKSEDKRVAKDSSSKKARKNIVKSSPKSVPAKKKGSSAAPKKSSKGKK